MSPENAARFEAAIRAQDAAQLERAVFAVARGERFAAADVPLLCDLLLATWHTRHEDIASVLQGLRDTRSVPALERAARTKLDYLAYNESHALARKCVWALADIGTAGAKTILEAIAVSEDAEVAGYARRRLDRWDEELRRKRGD